MKRYRAHCGLVAVAQCLVLCLGCSDKKTPTVRRSDAGRDGAAPASAGETVEEIGDAGITDGDTDADGESNDAADGAERAVVRIRDNITDPTTWLHGNLYVVEVSIQVLAPLTIEPDTIVKFGTGVSISVGEGGSILADAQSATTPCLFTSLKDDAHGGDTNGDDTASEPQRGDWGYVALKEDGSVFNYCRFLYGGGNMPYVGTLMLEGKHSATITNCTFGHDQGGTPSDTRAAALNASAGGAATVITGNTFFDNDVPLVISGAFSLDDTNVFRESAAADATTNKYNGIFWGGTSTSGSISWTNTNAPYVVVDNPLGIAAGSSLTIGDKVIVKFDKDQRFDVSGRLTANGTTGLQFTSLRDDAAGGDTNGDGDATTAAPGDWRTISIGADGSVLNRVRFSYGGSAKPYTGTVSVAGNHTATITNCTFLRNAGGTIDDNRAAALNLGGASAATTVTGNLFYANDMPLVINGLVSIDASNVFHHDETAGAPLTNKLNGIFMDGAQHMVKGSTTWSNTEVAYVLYNAVLSIEEGGTLTLGNNVVVKAEKARIDMATGHLSQGNGDVFTSLRDDSRLGDTNGDSGANQPGSTGDWEGIKNCQSSPCEWVTGSNIYYAQHM